MWRTHTHTRSKYVSWLMWLTVCGPQLTTNRAPSSTLLAFRFFLSWWHSSNLIGESGWALADRKKIRVFENQRTTPGTYFVLQQQQAVSRRHPHTEPYYYKESSSERNCFFFFTIYIFLCDRLFYTDDLQICVHSCTNSINRINRINSTIDYYHCLLNSMELPKHWWPARSYFL